MKFLLFSFINFFRSFVQSQCGLCCVVIGEQRKKNAAFPKRPSRPISTSVVMMKEFSPVAPKGKVRQYLVLKGKIQTMRITKDTLSALVREKIEKAFDVAQFTALECDGTGHGLLKSSQQEIDGEFLVQRRGSLYLCESFKVCTMY